MKHTPVLLQSVTHGFDPKKGTVLLDGTFGAGGHSIAICKSVNDDMTVIAIDTDEESLKRAVAHFRTKSLAHIVPFASNYAHFDIVLKQHEIKTVDYVLLDLGFSSDQIEASGRGISFMKDEPLQMTLKSFVSESDLTAEEIVNTWDEQNLTDIIRYYGEERYAFRIAKAIIQARTEKRIQTTLELVHIIESAVPVSYRKQRIHPATRTFQALRITVNDELGVLGSFLDRIPLYLSNGGRIAIISFHSLEDRIVKKRFIEWEKEGIGKRITKKPIIADEIERKVNPRSRSAKLRIFEKQHE